MAIVTVVNNSHTPTPGLYYKNTTTFNYISGNKLHIVKGKNLRNTSSAL